MPTVLIVDDHDIVRQGVRHILETEAEWQVVGEATDGKEALRLNKELKPDLIVMDITMPVMGGLEATTEITKANPSSKILILSMHEGSMFVKTVQTAGAKGLVTKSKAASQLLAALQKINSGDTYFH